MARLEADDSADSWLGDAIAVDLHSVSEFARFVEADADAGLRPHAVRLAQLCCTGSRFGCAVPSANLAWARDRHDEALIRARDLLEAYIRATDVIVDAARTIAARYADADGFARARVDEVEPILSAAIAAAQSAVELPGQADDRREAARAALG
ncbi:MAG TPA: hypothetical protein VF054_07225 [Micromonosporaceae bacterium]